MGGRTCRGGGRTGEPTDIVGGRTGDQDGERGNHVNNQGNNENRKNNVIIDNIQGDVRNVNMNKGQDGCSYKEFLPKDFDAKGDVIAYWYLHSFLMFPAIKQLARKWWDEYGFDIHP
nr:hypothetical protein [Tanacetum cinerariifolium]